MQATKKGRSHERAADEKVCQIHDTMPQAVAQVTRALKIAKDKTRQLTHPISVTIRYADMPETYGPEGIAVHLRKLNDLDLLPGALVVRVSKYRTEIYKLVDGAKFYKLLCREDWQEEAVKGVLSGMDVVHICMQLGGDQECRRGLSPLCCYDIPGCENGCGASCLVHDPESCIWRREAVVSAS